MPKGNRQAHYYFLHDIFFSFSALFAFRFPQAKLGVIKTNVPDPGMEKFVVKFLLCTQTFWELFQEHFVII